MRRHVRIASLLAALGLAFFCGFLAWPVDIITGRVNQLASLEFGGERFRVIQFWGPDSYTDQLEHISADGRTTRHEIDGDDMKRWSCHVSLVEPERKLTITFPGDSRYFEYYWDTRRLHRNGNKEVWF